MEEELRNRTGGTREQPTAAEADFIERLEALMPRALEYYFWRDRDGTPWMIAFHSFSEMRGTGMALVKTARLDFDSVEYAEAGAQTTWTGMPTSGRRRPALT